MYRYEPISLVEQWKKRLNSVFDNTDICDNDRKELEEHFAKIFREIHEITLFLYDKKYPTIVGGVNLKKSSLDVATMLMNLYLGLYQIKIRSMRDYNELIKTMLYDYEDINRYLIDISNFSFITASNDEPIAIKDEIVEE